MSYRPNDESWWQDEWESLYEMVSMMPLVCNSSPDLLDRERKHARITAMLAEIANDARNEVLRLRREIQSLTAKTPAAAWPFPTGEKP